MADEIETGPEPVAESVSDNSAIIETPEAPQSLDDAISSALEATRDDDRPRDELGRFAPKDNTPPDPQPQEKPEPIDAVAPEPVAAVEFDLARHFKDAEAVKAWGTVPAPVQAEVARRVSELEAGHARVRDQIAPFQPFLDRAKATGSDPVQALHQYLSIEDKLRADPLGGIDMICRNMGTDIRSVAAHIMGQPAPEPNVEIQHLRQEVTRLQQIERHFQTHQQTEATKRQSDVEKTVTEFSASHPRLDELAPIITGFLPSFQALPPAEALDAAYRLAEQVRPAPVTSTAVLQQDSTPTPKVPQPNPKAHLAISGAPSSGSNPASRPKIQSLDAAISDALATMRN
jgi:hypothetical protein